ncbi:hypothetical protein GEMRC1_004929 [Eukaryota sp. GEM-RC1]
MPRFDDILAASGIRPDESKPLFQPLPVPRVVLPYHPIYQNILLNLHIPFPLKVLHVQHVCLFWKMLLSHHVVVIFSVISVVSLQVVRSVGVVPLQFQVIFLLDG